MKKFSESFYTDDFDQEMLNFIQDNFKLERKNTYTSPFLEDNTILRYSVTVGNFWTTDSWSLELFGTYLTKEQFKEKIGMTNGSQSENSTFTKSMLKSGEHVVKLNDGSYLLVLGNKLVDHSGWYNLNAFDEDLSHKQHSVEVENIYTTTEHFALEDLSEGKSLTLLRERESPEQKEKRLQKENLELKLQELQKECKLVEDEIMKLGD